eukprot:CAMPEP_0179225856 /NCGR_PEP_ID=MMETSP0797-20121207/8518_1 /TAXON_ID=47934 /ORGANISM="Dinophysis acuminata, Strain DAEP01" /LENGTH=723 /DNA_ID=CAMNT_0020932875 /DNA_START=57 /DNA_END=2228 /DNA_ORIENTATION=-
MAGVGSKTELLNVLGDVKARVQDKLGIVDFPMPQFICIGKQSVGKSRLIEALAGETFNFISGSLGSRRPTVLEFRNISTTEKSRWYVRDRETNQWQLHPIERVMQIVGAAHEELGETVSAEPIHVRVESAACIDMQMVDLPGFRDFALDASKQDLSNKIQELVMGFMRDTRNVMLCVEQCGDAATMSTLARCRELDPQFKRTILIRNKLDKYYNDLTSDNVNKWVDGFGDLPQGLTRFALSLPWWHEGQPPSKPFVELRSDMHAQDMQKLQERSLEMKYQNLIGFNNFAEYIDKKVEQMFADAVNPVLEKLKELKGKTNKTIESLKQEIDETDPNRILNTTRDCGCSLASALGHVMEGIPSLKVGRLTLEEELHNFSEYHRKLGSEVLLLPTEDFCGLDDYVEYLLEADVQAADVEVNGGAQFRRVMAEVEIFLRFSEIAVETKKRDVIQARGISMSSLTWREVVVKLLSNEAHIPLERRVRYVGERIKWFFMTQKEVTLDFMLGLDGNTSAKMYSGLFPKHAKLIKQNEMIKYLVFQTFDMVCTRQMNHFLSLFASMLTSTFANPWVFLKGGTVCGPDGNLHVQEDDDEVKRRIPEEIQNRASIENKLCTWLKDIPEEAHEIDDAVDKVQMLVLKVFGLIRSQVCDQVELFAESFFKLPMLRRLEDDMSKIELTEADEANYRNRRDRLAVDLANYKKHLQEVNACIERIQEFKFKCDAQHLK